MLNSIFTRLSEKRSQLLTRDTVYSRFALGAFWSLVGTGIAQALTMLASIIAARWLGRVGFGELGMIRSTAGTFGILAGLGLGLTVTKFVAEYRTSDPDRAGRIIGLTIQVALVSTLLVSGLLFISSPLVAEQLLNAPHLETELRFGALLLFANAMNGMFIGALSGLEAFKTLTQVSVIQGLLTLPLMLLGIRIFNIAGAIIGLSLAALVGLLLFVYALIRESAKHKITIRFGNIRKEMSIFLAFSIPALLSQALVGPVFLLSNAILARQPEGYREIGLLSVVFQWRTLLLFLPMIFIKVALPMMSSSNAENENGSDYEDTLIITHGLTILVILPLAVLLMFFSELVLSLYGSEFKGGSLVLIGLLGGIMISGLGTATGPAIQSKGKMWLGFGINLSWGITLLIIVWIFAPSWGALAYAVGSIAATSLITIWTFIYLKNDLPKSMLPRIFAALGIVLITTLVCAILPPKMRIVLAVPITISFFFLSIFVFPHPRFRNPLLRLFTRTNTISSH